MGAELPPEAEGRLRDKAFSSGLTVPDFAACLEMGMRPVGLVQGFCVMRWSWYAGSSWGAYYRGGNRTLSSYACPHGYGMSNEHRTWGENYELTQMNDAWRSGYASALRRMIEEAQEAGAHGVVGVIDRTSHLIDDSIHEFHLMGTAVVLDGHQPSGNNVFTTFLAGQRLAKLIEAGFMPVAVVATSETVRTWEVCVTETLLRGRSDMYGMVTPGDEITQLADAHMEARRGARDHIRSLLGNDVLHGARMEVFEREVGEGLGEVTCILRGTRVHQFKDADPLPAPVPTVRLS